MRTMIQAHRGASAYRPENTLAAFSLAVEQGADGVELDVHLTNDGHVVVAHDERLERVSDGTGLIYEHTLAELRRFNFNKLFPQYEARGIPTLGEVYELVVPSGITVNVELKTTALMYPGLTKKLAELAREYGLEDRIMYSSFNHYSLMEMRRYEPEAKIGLLYQLGLVDPWVYANYLRADAIHPHYFIVAALPETVAKCHEHGVKINVWTVDDDDAIKHMLSLGVDGVITNRPDAAVTLRDRHEEAGQKK